jgi:hypothetical protein
MKVYGGVNVQIHIFLTSVLVGGECSASPLGRFISKERASGTHWTGGWVGPRTGVADAKKRKPRPYQDSNSGPWAVEPVASRCT